MLDTHHFPNPPYCAPRSVVKRKQIHGAYAFSIILLSLVCLLIPTSSSLAGRSLNHIRLGVHEKFYRIVFNFSFSPKMIFMGTNHNNEVIFFLKEKQKISGIQKALNLRPPSFHALFSHISLRPYRGGYRLIMTVKAGLRLKTHFLLKNFYTGQFLYVFDFDKSTFSGKVPTPQIKVKHVPKSLHPHPLPCIKPRHPIVVIDPGHGGKDPGTVSLRGKYEKDLTLDAALRLKAHLEKKGICLVHLTRNKDIHLSLRKRFAIARDLSADLFISLHADSNPNKALKGVSIYTLSNQASDKEAERVAKKENLVDALWKDRPADIPEDIHTILLNIAWRNSLNKSIEFAEVLLNNVMTKKLNAHKSQRFADFAVLKAHDIPSVLIELGYISNPQDALRLNTREYLNSLTTLIADGIDKYFTADKKRDQTRGCQVF